MKLEAVEASGCGLGSIQELKQVLRCYHGGVAAAEASGRPRADLQRRRRTGGDLERTAEPGKHRSELLESRRRLGDDPEGSNAEERPGASSGAAAELKHVRAVEGLKRRAEGRSSLLALWRCSGEASEQLRRTRAVGRRRRS